LTNSLRFFGFVGYQTYGRNSIMALPHLTPERSYAAIRENAAAYLRPVEALTISGMDRIALVSWLLPKSTEYAQPGTAVESLVLNRDGSVAGMAIAIIGDDEVTILCEAPAPLAPTAAEGAAELGLDAVTIGSAALAAVAVEGPLSWLAVDDLLADPIADVLLWEWREASFDGAACRLIRTGTTAEYGYLVVIGAEHQAALLSALGEAAAAAGGGIAEPTSLERARAEVNHPVLPAQTAGLSVFEAGVQWCMTLNRDEDYLGRAGLSFDAPARRTIACVAPDADAPPVGTPVCDGDRELGHVQVSLPRLGERGGYALAVLDADCAVPGLLLTAGGVALHTVSRPAIDPRSWAQQIGERE
jgi:aminomethyltransferase